MTDPSFRRAVAEVAPACRALSDRDLKAFTVACLAEMARRDGATETASWASAQATRLRCLDAITV